MIFSIDPKKKLLLSDVATILGKQLKIELSENAKKEIISCREFLDNKIKNSVEPIYGINTGFGSLYNIKIPNEDLEKLQE
ncbi:MAG: aromatic amino acid lyase, partial [Bacteroidia bacterium]|nr:aromatic amino acid lyase [Bacteroidia bacterium]